MRVDRRVFLLTAASAAACSWKRERSSLTRAAQYLWAQQAADGGFHSATYGLLRSGQSLTPFVLGALLRVPDATVSAPPAPSIVQLRSSEGIRAPTGPWA